MAKTAFEVISEQVEWAQDKLIYTAIEHLADNFDSFPVLGFGLSFMKKSAEKVIVRRLENDIVPDIEEHISLELTCIRKLAEADDKDALLEEYRGRLLDDDPFLDSLDVSDDELETIREELWSHNREVMLRAASWIEEAGDETYENYADLAVSLGKTPDQVAEEIEDILHYVELLEDHREHVDMSGYSSALEHSKVHAWFLDTLIDGLEKGRAQVIDDVRERITERQSLE